MPLKSKSFKTSHPQETLGFLLWQTTITWQRAIKQVLQPYDISHAQFVVMALMLWLEETGKTPTQTEIIGWSKLDKMTVSKSIRTLSKLQLVKQYEDELDARTKRVQLTVQGQELVKAIIPHIEACDAHFFTPLTDEEHIMMKAILKKLVARVI